jgi:23S rRNA pseudouridine2605 synthase
VTSVTGQRVGLARALSKLGYCSRSAASRLIGEGQVAVNGTVQRDPERPVSWQRDRIEVEGRRVAAAGKVYLMLNKPRGVVTSAADEKGRPTVYAGLEANLPWVGPVGRLDKASEGLLLLTNDSEWAARVQAPETHLDKTYHVQIASVADEALLTALIRGLASEGDLIRAKRARFLRGGQKNSWLEIVLDEGRNRQIRRMLAACDIAVMRLVRVAIGPLTLGELAKGESRFLTEGEKQRLDAAMRKSTRVGAN